MGRSTLRFSSAFLNILSHSSFLTNVATFIFSSRPVSQKSSIINSLAHKKKAKVGKKPGTTHGIHWISIGDNMKLIDSPGVIPLTRDDEIRYGLIGARDNDKLKNPEIVSNAIIKLLLKKNKFHSYSYI